MSRKIERLARLAAAAVLGLALSACQSQAGPAESPSSAVTTPSPSSSPTPSVDPTEGAIAERAGAAEDRYREFRKISEDFALRGESPFWELNDNHFIAGEYAESQQTSWESFEMLEQKWTGKVPIESIELAGFDGDPLREEITGQRVHFRVCLDNSDRDILNPDGSSAIRGGQGRVLMNVALQGQPGGEWSVVKNEATDEGC